MDYGLISILPIVIVVILAFHTKNVIISLLIGVLSGGLVLDIYTNNYFTGIESISRVFSNNSNVKIILFCLFVGAFINILEASNGVNGLLIFLTEKHKLVKSKFGAQMISYILGVLIFIDGNSSIVISGVTARPFFDKYKESRTKLAYILDSTSSPVAWLFPFAGAGAYFMSLLSSLSKQGVINENPLSLVIKTIPYQIYGIISILLVFVSIVLKKNFDPITIKDLEITENKKVNLKNSENKIKPKAMNMIVPIIVLISSIFILLEVTGNGNILKGDSSTATFVGISITLIIICVFYWIQNIANPIEFIDWCIKGITDFLPIVMILVLALCLSDISGSLNTGKYISEIAIGVPSSVIPLIIFIVSAIISLGTGTSGGTLSIMIPIAIPMAINFNIYIPVVLGAIISGGVFGDHCSPISDSTILSSMIAEVEVMDHVKTQFPYALFGAIISALCFLAMGMIL